MDTFIVFVLLVFVVIGLGGFGIVLYLQQGRQAARRAENVRRMAREKHGTNSPVVAAEGTVSVAAVQSASTPAAAAKQTTTPELDLVNLPYVKCKALLREGERAFFPILRQACGDRVLIFAQVQLSRLLYPRTGTAHRRAYQNKIDRKSVDFVLCDPKNLQVQLVIELDDRSHATRQKRDEFVNRALSVAGIPILRVRAAARYDAGELEGKIRAGILESK